MPDPSAGLNLGAAPVPAFLSNPLLPAAGSGNPILDAAMSGPAAAAAPVAPAPPAAAPDPSTTPAPQPGSPDLAALPPPPTWNRNRSLIGDVLDQVLLGGAIRHTQEDNYTQALRDYGTQRSFAVQAYQLQHMSPEQRSAYLANPDKYGEEVAKNFAPIATAPGATTTMFGRQSFTAPMFDPTSGKWTNPSGAGPSIGGDFDMAGNGALFSKRDGSVQGIVPHYSTSPDGVTSADNIAGAPIAHVTPQYQKLDAGGGRQVGGFQAPPIIGADGQPTPSAGGSPFPAMSGAQAAPGARGAFASQIGQAADAAGLSPTDKAQLLATGSIESGLNPASRPNGSSTGGFQFKPDTFRSVMPNGDINSPADQTQAAIKLQQANKSALRQSLGREPTPGETYLAHQQGIGGARALLANPNTNAVDAIAPIYEAKYGVATGQRRARQAILNNGGTADMTAGQFADHWSSAVNSRMGAGAPSDGASVPPPTASVTGGYSGPMMGPSTAPLLTEPTYNPKTGAYEQTNTATGEVTKTDAPAYGVKEAGSDRAEVLKNPVVQDAYKAVTAANGLNGLMKQLSSNNGIMNMAAFDSFTRSLSGSAARVGNVQMAMDHIGVPEELGGQILKVTGNGAVTPQVLHYIQQTLGAYAAEHLKTAQGIADNYESFAQRSSGGKQGLGLALPSLDPVSTPEFMHHGPGAVPRDPAATSAPVRLTGASAASQYASLPSGAHFIDPNGVARIKR